MSGKVAMAQSFTIFSAQSAGWQLNQRKGFLLLSTLITKDKKPCDPPPHCAQHNLYTASCSCYFTNVPYRCQLSTSFMLFVCLYRFYRPYFNPCVGDVPEAPLRSHEEGHGTQRPLRLPDRPHHLQLQQQARPVFVTRYRLHSSPIHRGMQNNHFVIFFSSFLVFHLHHPIIARSQLYRMETTSGTLEPQENRLLLISFLLPVTLSWKIGVLGSTTLGKRKRKDPTISSALLNFQTRMDGFQFSCRDRREILGADINWIIIFLLHLVQRFMRDVHEQRVSRCHREQG